MLNLLIYLYQKSISLIKTEPVHFDCSTATELVDINWKLRPSFIEWSWVIFSLSGGLSSLILSSLGLSPVWSLSLLIVFLSPVVKFWLLLGALGPPWLYRLSSACLSVGLRVPFSRLFELGSVKNFLISDFLLAELPGWRSFKVFFAFS